MTISRNLSILADGATDYVSLGSFTGASVTGASRTNANGGTDTYLQGFYVRGA